MIVFNVRFGSPDHRARKTIKTQISTKTYHELKTQLTFQLTPQKKVSAKLLAKSNAQFELIYSALKAYKKIHKNVLVPRAFVVPQGDERYPAHTWGIKLGTVNFYIFSLYFGGA